MAFNPFSSSDSFTMATFNNAFNAMFASDQNLTNGEKDQARKNIDAAPSGYGLGTTASEQSTDANTLSGTGFFKCYLNTPTNTWWYGYQIESIEGYRYQRFVKSNSAEIAERKQLNGVWQPWEYVNPPMTLGVEYRTTERYLGKPVYATLIDCGTIADGKQVEHGIANINLVISATARRVSMPLPLVYNKSLSDNWTAYLVEANETTLIFACGSSAAGGNCAALMKYTKTTD